MRKTIAACLLALTSLAAFPAAASAYCCKCSKGGCEKTFDGPEIKADVDCAAYCTQKGDPGHNLDKNDCKKKPKKGC